MYDNYIVFSLFDEYVNHYKIYTYQFVTSTSFYYQFDPSTYSHAFEVEVHEFITCLQDLILEQMTIKFKNMTFHLKSDSDFLKINYVKLNER